VKSSSVPELTALLDHAEKETRHAAAEGLAGMLTTAVDLPALQKMTKHQDAEVRALAFKSVGKLGQDARSLLPELLEAAKTDRGDTRKAALMILATLTAAEAKPVIPLINQALKDGDKETRQLSLQVVAKLGNDSTSLIPQVRDALKDPEVCKDALAALGKLGANARNAVPAMAECLKSEDETVRDAALKALGDLGINGAAATNEIINLFDKARDFKTREEGSAYLDKLAPVVAKFGRAAVPSLIKALQEDNAMIRWGACRTLGLMGSNARDADRHLLALSQIEQNLFIVQEAEKARRKITAR
jgi:HEAT repeat protein